MDRKKPWQFRTGPPREEGQGMAEYSLIIGLIAIGLVTTFGMFASTLAGLYGRLATAIGGV